MYEYACSYEFSYLISVITQTSTHDLQVKKFAFMQVLVKHTQMDHLTLVFRKITSEQEFLIEHLSRHSAFTLFGHMFSNS